MLKIYESLICKQLFGHETDEDDAVCKSSPVQNELALLNSWKGTFDQLPGIALALLYGLAADRIGPKPVLLLALTGLMLEESFIRLISWCKILGLVPLRAICLTPIFQLIGSGPGIATSMAYSIITDTFPASQRASIYFLLAAAIFIGEILATPLSAFLMSRTPWLPSLAGIGCQVFGLVAAASVSETRPP
ncbi:hypothetical protein BKA67DRAFT_665185 [Truncatella angustata]|uniref:Major facilitator superfamily (MFS) profile domain-containing protein n=1 Tax=Truncatella angustata TaxID=152316 RepID=A0A9P8RF87_9PEZI|nr:uncharacterized protein BKA67DRAFT_665185 [Truncatella angustata]KAH6643371.1 hypothetical protein BKA67DRAFT_665185 [Truncatella angustata]